MRAGWRRWRRRAVVAVAVVAAAGAAGCGIPTDHRARPVAPRDVPFGLLEPGPTTTSAPPR